MLGNPQRLLLVTYPKTIVINYTIILSNCGYNIITILEKRYLAWIRYLFNYLYLIIYRSPVLKLFWIIFLILQSTTDRPKVAQDVFYKNEHKTSATIQLFKRHSHMKSKSGSVLNFLVFCRDRCTGSKGCGFNFLITGQNFLTKHSASGISWMWDFWNTSSRSVKHSFAYCT